MKKKISKVVKVVALRCKRCDHQFIVREKTILFELSSNNSVGISTGCPACGSCGAWPLGDVRKKRHK